MNESKNKLCIGVFGHYGNQNLGDEAIIEAVISNCREWLPQASISCFSIAPEDTEKRHNVPSYPIRKLPKSTSETTSGLTNEQTSEPPTFHDVSNKNTSILMNKNNLKDAVKKIPIISTIIRKILYILFLLKESIQEIPFLIKSYKILKYHDLLLISGSNQFLDNFGGPWGFPYTLLKWTILSKVSGTKVAYISVGAGPLDTKLGQFFVKLALSLSDYQSFRDKGSLNLIKNIGFKDSDSVYPDLAFSLHRKSKNPVNRNNGTTNDLPLIGINPMPVYDVRYWCESNPALYEKYINKFASISTFLLENNYPFFFFSTQPKDKGVIQDIISIIQNDIPNNQNKKELIRHCTTVDEVLTTIEQADIIVATRFHGVLLALLSLKPTAAICYGNKTYELMADVGQKDFAFEIDNFDPEMVIKSLEKLGGTRESVNDTLRTKTSKYLELLQVQYKDVFNLIL